MRIELLRIKNSPPTPEAREDSISSGRFETSVHQIRIFEGARGRETPPPPDTAEDGHSFPRSGINFFIKKDLSRVAATEAASGVTSFRGGGRRGRAGFSWTTNRANYFFSRIDGGKNGGNEAVVTSRWKKYLLKGVQSGGTGWCKFNFDRWIWIQSVVGGRFEMVTRVRQTSNGLPAPLIKSLSFRWLLSTVARSLHAALQALKNWLLKCHGHRVEYLLTIFNPRAIPSIDHFFSLFFFFLQPNGHTFGHLSRQIQKLPNLL